MWRILVFNILVIADVGNYFKTISKYVKNSKIHIINFPKDGAGIYTYDENYELFENYKVSDQVKKINEIKNKYDLCITTGTGERIAYLCDLNYVPIYFGRDIDAPRFVKNSTEEWNEEPLHKLNFLERYFYKKSFNNAILHVAGSFVYKHLKKYSKNPVNNARVFVDKEIFNEDIKPITREKTKFIFFSPNRIEKFKGTDILWNALQYCKTDFEILQVNWFGETQNEEKLFKKNILKNIDGVFHQAALTVVQDSFSNPKEYHDVNVQGTENIFKLAKENDFLHTQINITPETIINSWRDAIYYMEQPMYNQSIAMYCYTNKFLSDNGIVVTMAGDMGDEILGGYPKYWKMRRRKYLKSILKHDKIRNWKDVITLWGGRIKRPLLVADVGGDIPKEDILELLTSIYPNDLWNSADPIGSAMALDCITQVPEEFFNRNDKYGMAYGMEGRFPLATKMFMQYCMDIHSDEKIGLWKDNTKGLTKKAYKNLLPKQIINKSKTGWTVPVGDWMTKNESAELNNLYKVSLGEKSGLDIIKTSQKAGKALLPAWIINDWMKVYKIKNEN